MPYTIKTEGLTQVEKRLKPGQPKPSQGTVRMFRALARLEKPSESPSGASTIM